MPEGTYLITRYIDREAVKALGARWDAEVRRWFVPPGRDLAPFAAWLPATEEGAAPSAARALAAPPPPAYEVDVPRKGVALSQLLAAVGRAVAQAFCEGVWTVVEVVDARLRGGHVYLEVSERDARGTVTAKATAIIWAGMAARILPEFECATGAKVGPGIKLLLRVLPVFKPQYGLSLEVQAIDPEYTLGDLEARRREIRQRLQREGLYGVNRALPAPWDFNRVLVVAPEDAAGLGDFRAEADRLDREGVCRFTYAHSRFQGEGAAAQVRAVLLEALADWGRADDRRSREAELPDAVAIIRGGGAVNDLAWLDDYDLARAVCELRVPVFTGIGHERDTTVLDEVAHTSFDTPSKLILGIESVIRTRVQEAHAAHAAVLEAAARGVAQAAQALARQRHATVTGALQQLATARERIGVHRADVHLHAAQTLHDARAGAQLRRAEVSQLARQQLALARQAAPALLAAVRERAGTQADAMRREAARHAGDTRAQARRVLREAATRAEALMREVAGQGPDKTLGRGFALVRGTRGEPLMRAGELAAGEPLSIEFRDGAVAAMVTGPAHTPVLPAAPGVHGAPDILHPPGADAAPEPGEAR
ncbi:MAG: hypothetical protein RI988_1732 [Pseudomonadota bacterium]|jgi:exodeoxyribonuclease VII large subunit